MAAAPNLQYACAKESEHSTESVTVKELTAPHVAENVKIALCKNGRVKNESGGCKLKADDGTLTYDNKDVLTSAQVKATIVNCANVECACTDKTRIGHLIVQYLVVVSTMFCIGEDILKSQPQDSNHANCNVGLVGTYTHPDIFRKSAADVVTSLVGALDRAVTLPDCIVISQGDPNTLQVKLKSDTGHGLGQDLRALCIPPIMTALIMLNMVMSDAVEKATNNNAKIKTQQDWNKFVEDATCLKQQQQQDPAPAQAQNMLSPAGSVQNMLSPAGSGKLAAPPAVPHADPPADPLSPAPSGDPGIGGSPIGDFIRQTDATSFVDGMLSPRTSPSP